MSPSEVKFYSLFLSVLVLVNQFEIALLANNNVPPSRLDHESDNVKLGDSLKFLTVGELPSVLLHRNSLKSSGSQSHTHHLLKSSGGGGGGSGGSVSLSAPPPVSASETSPFGTGPFSKFDVKHTYIKDGVQSTPTNPLDSFADFTRDPAFAKKYLVEMNLNIHNAAILPPKRATSDGEWKQFDKWLEMIDNGQRQITIVDSDSAALLNDIDTSVKQSLYLTENEHTYTQIHFETVKNSEGKVIEVIAKAAKGKDKIQIGLDEVTGKPDHLEKPLTTPPKKDSVEITRFNIDELKRVATVTEDMWSAMPGRPGRKKLWALDTKNQAYIDARAPFDSELEKIFDGTWTSESASGPAHTPSGSSSSSVPGACISSRGRGPGSGRRKRSALSEEGCAIFVNPDTGEVEQVDPEKFLEQYEKANDAERRKLAELAGNVPPEKIMNSELDEVNTQRMKSLVELEDLKKQVHNLEQVHEVFHMENSKSIESVEKIEKLQETLETSKVKLSPSRFSWSLANSKMTKAFVHWVHGVGAPLGHFFLMKNVITGIIHGDTTSLAIVGGRMGFDLVAAGIEKFGTKFFSAASKMGKTVNFIGEVAGPIGAVVDIAMGVWSLSGAIDRLKNATNVYDRNDAIADVVNESVNLAVSYAVLAVSIAFPPFAPIAVAVGLVITLVSQFVNSIFHAGNEVARINSEVPLLGFEKVEVFESRFFDWFGTRSKDYIDYLVEEKKANDMAVQLNLQFLQENDQIRGIVFPSRTLHYDGKCRLTKSYCHFNLFGCWSWSGDENISPRSTGCDWNRPCPGKPCTDSSYGWNRERCICDGEETSTFGEPRLNQIVDLREKVQIYHDRALPKDVAGAEFICKPGSVTFLDYKISQEYSSTDYKCENAIGLLQPPERRKNGQFLYINLDNGTDTVYLNEADPTPTIFDMGDWGRKEFHGSGGRNEYIFNSTCNNELAGSLVGGKSDEDTISIMQTCGKGDQLVADFNSGNLKLANSAAFQWQFADIEEINGRKGESDHVIVSCTTKRVALQGSKNGYPDLIEIGEGEGCHYNMTLVVEEHSQVVSNARNGSSTYLLGSQTAGISMTLDIYSNSTPKTNILFYSSGSKDITSFHQIYSPSQVELVVSLANATPAKFIFMNKTNSENDTVVPPIYFTEDPPGSPQSVLLPGPDNSTIVYHSLSGNFTSNAGVTPSRIGSTFLRNVMVVQSPGLASVKGGNQSDDYILHWPVQEIHGEGGEDSIRLHSSLTEPVDLDLTGTKYTGIENVLSSPGKKVRVVASCTTKMITALGGNSTNSDADAKVIIPRGLECSKSKRQLQIVAKGSSSITVESPVKDFDKDGVSLAVFAANSSAPKENEFSLNFQMVVKTNDTNGLSTVVFLEHKNWTVLEHSSKDGIIKAKIFGKGNFEESMEFQFSNLSNDSTKEKFLSNIPTIELVHFGETSFPGEPVAQLLFESDSGMPSAYFRLGENATKANVTGYTHIANSFQILNTSWSVIGGELDDQFYLRTSASRTISIDGSSGTNGLVLEKDPDPQENNATTTTLPTSPKTFLVNLEKGKIGFLQTPDEDKGTIQNVHSVIGRPNKPEIMFAACSTNFLNGAGGVNPSLPDTVFISGSGDNCTNQKLTVNVGNFTIVKNSAATGEFTYFIHNFHTTDVKLNVTKDNQHHFHFLFTPWKAVKKIAFDFKSETLGFKLMKPSHFLNGSDEIYYKMSRANSTLDYSNPTFQFQKPDSKSLVVTTLGVNKDGAVGATFLISGRGPTFQEDVEGLSVDVNRFLINVTEIIPTKDFGNVVGSNDTNANQFWLFNLKTPLNTLDGGECENCTNYLHLEENFQIGAPLEVDLGSNGFLRTSNGTLIKNLRNIHAFYGRSSFEGARDKATVTCKTRSIVEVEEIIVRYEDNSKGLNCPFNLIIGVGLNTSIWFTEGDSFNRSGYNSSADAFNYIFTAPRSFDPDGSEGFPTWLIGPNHNYVFSFTLDDLQSLTFDEDAEKLCYSVVNETGKFCHSMLTSPYILDQFYSQPQMMTKDGFRIQISRVGDILLSLGGGSSFPSQEVIESKIIPAFEKTSRRLDATIIVQTDKDYLHVGHDNSSVSRNILQNVDLSTSHLVGGGMHNTIYKIVSLQKDVYIYPGLAEPDPNHNQNDLEQQTLDLSEVVMDIRMTSGKKFVPGVHENGSDLVITMEPYDATHPGKVTIVNGTYDQIWRKLQILLHTTLMDLSFDNSTNNWAMKPKPVKVPNGYLYHIAPEDLEDNHEIHFEEGGDKNFTKTSDFILARNGSDLFISNVLRNTPTSNSSDSISSRRPITTVVINSFFDEKKWKPKVQVPRGKAGGEVDYSSLPAKIYGVNATFPGLQLALDGTQVMQMTDNADNRTSNLKKAEVLQWGCVLRQAEKDLLKDMPKGSIQNQHFNYEDCEVPSSFSGILFAVLATLVLSLVVMLTVGRGFISRHTGRLIGEISFRWRVYRNQYEQL